MLLTNSTKICKLPHGNLLGENFKAEGCVLDMLWAVGQQGEWVKFSFLSFCPFYSILGTFHLLFWISCILIAQDRLLSLETQWRLRCLQYLCQPLLHMHSAASRFIIILFKDFCLIIEFFLYEKVSWPRSPTRTVMTEWENGSRVGRALNPFWFSICLIYFTGIFGGLN